MFALILGIALFIIGMCVVTRNSQSRISWPMIVGGLALFATGAHAHDPAHKELDHWYSSVKQPDTGASCCGKSDAYFCDEGARAGKAICTINDNRDNAELGRVPIPNGTVIAIPDYKFNKDPNPTGRAVVWISPGGLVWCFVGISGS